MPVNTQTQAILKITVTRFLLVYGPSSFYRESSYLSRWDFLQISERQHLSSNGFKNSLVFPFSSFFLFVFFFFLRLKWLAHRLHAGAEIQCPRFSSLFSWVLWANSLVSFKSLYQLCTVWQWKWGRFLMSINREMEENLAPAFCFSNDKIDQRWRRKSQMKTHGDFRLYWSLRPA